MSGVLDSINTTIALMESTGAALVKRVQRDHEGREVAAVIIVLGHEEVKDVLRAVNDVEQLWKANTTTND